MHGHTTVGFVQVWLEVVSIISSAYPGFGSGLTNIAKHWFLIFIFSTKPGICSGGRNSNATPAQSPNVGSKPKTKSSTHWKDFMKFPLKLHQLLV